MVYAIALLIILVIVLIVCVIYLIKQVSSVHDSIHGLSEQVYRDSEIWRRIFDPTYPY